MAYMSLNFLWTHWMALSPYLTKFSFGLLGNARTGDIPRNAASSTSTQRDEEDGISSPKEHIHGGQVDQQSAPDIYPLTAEQVEESIQEFINSIDKTAVCAVASRYNGGKSCRVVDQRNGSFNICFFVVFEAEAETETESVTWVLRVPIEPVVVNSWAKVVSEVTTIRYIKRKTTIPIPQIHAYGKDATLVQGATTPFMLMDLVHGQQLHTKTFFHATESQRKNLYIDLIDILAQLRKLEFPAAGSLMPDPNNPDDELNPILGPFLSLTINELDRRRQEPLPAEVFTSVKSFVDLHCQILSETYELPAEELKRKQAKMELFALDSISKEIPKRIQLQEPNHSFILAHPDLRCGNIIVNDDFHILGIIDWEFTSTVPQQLFVPPPWITGHDSDAILIAISVPPSQILTEFGNVLEEMHKTSSGWTQLWQDWGFDQKSDLEINGPLSRLSPIIQILRHPGSLQDVYYLYIFPQLFGVGTKREPVVNDFFDENDNQVLAEQVELQIEKSERYTEYLRDRGLLVPDERAQHIRRVLKELDAMRQAYDEACAKKYGKKSKSPAESLS